MLSKTVSKKEPKGKVRYNISSKIDTGIRKIEDYDTKVLSPDFSDRAKLTTGLNSRVAISPASPQNEFTDVDNSKANKNVLNTTPDKLNSSISNSNQKRVNSTSLNKSISYKRPNSVNKFQNRLNDPNQSNIKTLENVIFEVKNNCFEKIKLEIDEKVKLKSQLEKNNELMKNKIKLSRDEIKSSSKQTHTLVLSTKQYKAVETRINHELMINDDIDDLRVEVSKLKFEYEARIEENRQLRNDILIEEKNVNLCKEDLQKTNKTISDCNREKENLKGSIHQLKKHVKLMKEKVASMENKNKDVLSKFYQLTLTSSS